MKFKELNLPEYLLNALDGQGFAEATEIQALTVPLLQQGRDVVGLSQTGSGKTYAFGIPAVQSIDVECNDIQVLVICPTRELVAQVCEEIRKLTVFKESVRLVPIFGGSNFERQVQAIKRGAKIIVGTPGRLMDHIKRRTLKLHAIKMLVLDEADEMLNMGFKEDIDSILKSTNKIRQTVMFSATMPKLIMDITKNYMNNPEVIKTERQDNAQTFIKQYYVSCARDKKNETLMELLNVLKPTVSITFCNTKLMVDKLSKELRAAGVPCYGLHGDLRQNERKVIMDRFKREGTGMLIATDVAARGIDIKNVDAVFNYDFPNNTEYYVHRIGRTARAGKEGTAVSILNTAIQVRESGILARQTGNVIEEYILSTSVKFENKTDGKKFGQSGGTGRNFGNNARRNDNSSRRPYGQDRQREGGQSGQAAAPRRGISDNSTAQSPAGQNRPYNNDRQRDSATAQAPRRGISDNRTTASGRPYNNAPRGNNAPNASKPNDDKPRTKRIIV